ncbi:phosphoadenosine phosphosulfate reductase family protein [Paraburkholderia sp. UCT31]|uniref:phosphoadenosine phosphosulfate reductase domain-containing protein n=1 Tax=Paraburkholderia sp. UCT31 TaxID=2615209 RepID=UPI001655C98A|nr:phosphoadenosine phosphosulfate reductase family protein [Paraburkholderia sp. UCT31]MBC8739789.1 phosphoadenosine phosphosulfate reductase family protein [Paraburkholderia sp. UCT31]
MMMQLDIFETPVQAEVKPVRMQMQEETLDEKIGRAVKAIRTLFQQSLAVSISFSGGKDSSALMHLTMEAAIASQAAGEAPHVVVFSSDTGVENPEVALLLRREHDKIRSHLTLYGIQHEVLLTQPSLAASWPVRVLSGSKLPSFPGNSHDCAVDFKVKPIRSARNAVFNALGKERTVTLIGTRFEESAERSRNMTQRGELAHTPYLNDEGEKVLSPIAFWTTDDVWELIGLVRAGVVSSYSDFEETFKLYADAGGTSCAVVSDAITEGIKKARGGCGARFGCYVCVAVGNDTSLDTMIETDERYSYMSGLNRLRNVIAKTRWDYSKRYWVQRSIDEQGNMKIQPDCYSPAFLLELFRYSASLDYAERRAAARLGIAPRFQLLSAETVVVIDALWSLNGYHAPHTALLEWLDISKGRAFYEVPDIAKEESAERKPLPKAIAYPVGKTWDGEVPAMFTGMRDALSTFADCRETRETNDGRTVLELETSKRMEVDVESLCMALDFEWDGILKRHNEKPTDWTAGYRFWTTYGTLVLSASQTTEHDDMLRRTDWRAKNGFLGEAGNIRAQALWMAAAKGPDDSAGQRLAQQLVLDAEVVG